MATTRMTVEERLNEKCAQLRLENNSKELTELRYEAQLASARLKLRVNKATREERWTAEVEETIAKAQWQATLATQIRASYDAARTALKAPVTPTAPKGNEDTKSKVVNG